MLTIFLDSSQLILSQTLLLSTIPHNHTIKYVHDLYNRTNKTENLIDGLIQLCMTTLTVLLYYTVTKGQLISNCTFAVHNSSKKRPKAIQLEVP